MIHAYTGDGKGKSTAALGLLIRAFGAGFRVFLLCFDKGSSTYRHHELAVLERLGIPFLVTGMERMSPDGTFRFGSGETDRREAERGIEEARKAILSGSFDLIVLDEILSAASCDLIGPDRILELLSEVPKDLEVVLTGRNRHGQLLEKADLVSEIRKVRHYFDRGVKARAGIEF